MAQDLAPAPGYAGFPSRASQHSPQFRRGLRRDDTRHVAIARWTLPIWLYVSVTGVVVYWMLYQL